MRSALLCISVSMALCSPWVQASDFSSLSFSHKDWQLVCDNTRTCRAVGYSLDGSDLPISVLLTRKAGPKQAVTGEIMVGQYGENAVVDKLPTVFRLSMSINEQTLGKTQFNKNSMVSPLTAKQVSALIAALKGTSEIHWTDGESMWELSNQGAAAVLLKMDEYQGRVGTQGALMRKGPKDEERVLPPLPIPEVLAAPLEKALSRDHLLQTQQAQALRKSLEKTLGKDDDCQALTDPAAAAYGQQSVSVTRLSASKLLASTLCWSGAYNSGHGYWVIDDSAAFNPILVTTFGSDFNAGTISATHKGRGLGDCWSSDEWTWDGRQFVHTASSSTGMCRLLAPGGAWSLPEILTQIRQVAR